MPRFANSNETQGSLRWYYYRDASIGQNTVIIDGANQRVDTTPISTFGTSGTQQGSAPNYDAALNTTTGANSTAFFTTDLTTAYTDGATSFKRGIRMVNSRRQILLQDEITATASVNWRMHTNATVVIDTAGGNKTATLTLNGQTLIATILSPSAATFSTTLPLRLPSMPLLPGGGLGEDADQFNAGVTVLEITLPGGQYSIQVDFQPVWPGLSASDYTTPPSVALADWSLTSH